LKDSPAEEPPLTQPPSAAAAPEEEEEPAAPAEDENNDLLDVKVWDVWFVVEELYPLMPCSCLNSICGRHV